MPEPSTMAEKQDFVAFSTVTAAPFGGASGSSAARAGSEQRWVRIPVGYWRVDYLEYTLSLRFAADTTF
jgi:hypothetical protein